MIVSFILSLDFRLPSSVSRLPSSVSRLRTSNSQLPTHVFRLPISNFGLQTPDSRLPSPDFRLPTPVSRLPTSVSRLPTYLPKSNLNPAKKERPYPICALPPDVPCPLLLPGTVLVTGNIEKVSHTDICCQILHDRMR